MFTWLIRFHKPKHNTDWSQCVCVFLLSSAYVLTRNFPAKVLYLISHCNRAIPPQSVWEKVFSSFFFQFVITSFNIHHIRCTQWITNKALFLDNNVCAALIDWWDFTAWKKQQQQPKKTSSNTFLHAFSVGFTGSFKVYITKTRYASRTKGGTTGKSWEKTNWNCFFSIGSESRYRKMRRNKKNGKITFFY